MSKPLFIQPRDLNVETTNLVSTKLNAAVNLNKKVEKFLLPPNLILAVKKWPLHPRPTSSPPTLLFFCEKVHRDLCQLYLLTMQFTLLESRLIRFLWEVM